jgi:hypothetical protein
MEEIDRINRFLIIITDSFPIDLEMTWVSKLAFLGTHARQGLWAEVKTPENESKETLWSLFSTGTTEVEKQVPFWEFLEESGKKVIVYPAAQPLQHSLNASDGELYQLLKQDDWSLFITTGPQDSGHQDVPPDSSDLDNLHLLDKEIETVALAAGSQTSLLVLSFPGSDHKGWVISGGPKIASIGNPGPVNLLDLPPTFLWLLGIEVPPYMAGRIMDEILDTDWDLTQGEMDILTDHLRGLGYLG